MCDWNVITGNIPIDNEAAKIFTNFIDDNTKSNTNSNNDSKNNYDNRKVLAISNRPNCWTNNNRNSMHSNGNSDDIYDYCISLSLFATVADDIINGNTTTTTTDFNINSNTNINTNIKRYQSML